MHAEKLWPYLLSIESWIGRGLINTIPNQRQEGPTLEGDAIIGVAGVGTAFHQTKRRKYCAAIAADNFFIFGRGIFVLLGFYDNWGQ